MTYTIDVHLDASLMGFREMYNPYVRVKYAVLGGHVEVFALEYPPTLDLAITERKKVHKLAKDAAIAHNEKVKSDSVLDDLAKKIIHANY